MPPDPQPFLELAMNFRAVWFDSYGVLKDAGGVIAGGPATLAALADAGIEVRVLTNDASRSQGQQAERFHDLGYGGLRAGHIITSGMMARLFLREKVTTGSVAYLGTSNAAGYVFAAGRVAVPVGEVRPEEYDDIAAVAFLDDEGFDYNTDLNAAINLLRARNVPVVVANSDKLYPVRGGRVALATGGIAQLVESLVGRAFMRFGKPDTQMFNYAFEDLNRDDSYAKREVLMVGDTLHTDILGGNRFGIQTCLTLSGNTSARAYRYDIDHSGILPDFVVEGIGS